MTIPMMIMSAISLPIHILCIPCETNNTTDCDTYYNALKCAICMNKCIFLLREHPSQAGTGHDEGGHNPHAPIIGGYHHTQTPYAS